MFIFAVFIKILMQWEAGHKNFATCEFSQATKLIFAGCEISQPAKFRRMRIFAGTVLAHCALFCHLVKYIIIIFINFIIIIIYFIYIYIYIYIFVSHI